MGFGPNPNQNPNRNRNPNPNPNPNENKKDIREQSGACGPLVGIRCGQKYFDNGYTTIKSWDQNPDGPDSPLVAQPISAQVAQKKSLQEINMEITVPY